MLGLLVIFSMAARKIWYLFSFSCRFFLCIKKFFFHFLFERTIGWWLNCFFFYFLRCKFTLFFVFFNFSNFSYRFFDRSFSLCFYWRGMLNCLIFLLWDDGIELFFVHFEFNLFYFLIIFIIGWIMRCFFFNFLFSPWHFDLEGSCCDLAW